MPKIRCICSRCGGTGQLQFLEFEGASIMPWWRAEICLACSGSGQVEAEDFHQRKRSSDGETEQKTDEAHKTETE